MEVAVVSCEGSVKVINPFTLSELSQVGTCSAPRHGLVASPRGVILCSEVGKARVRAWSSAGRELPCRLFAPDKVTCVAVSPDSQYLGLSCGPKVHLYQAASGAACGTGSGHFQPISVLRFDPEGTHVGAGGEDGLVSVWGLATLITSGPPRLRVNAHSLPVTDLVFSGGALRSHVFTTSLDRSCKIHSVWSGDKLFSGHFENQLTCLALCPRESALYTGDCSGRIRQISLLAPPRSVSQHISGAENQLICLAHQSRVTTLSVSLDGYLLLSGSDDSTLKLIHISSRQVINSIPSKGPVTNCFFYILPLNSTSTSFSPSMILENFRAKDSTEPLTFQVQTDSDIKSDLNIPTFQPPFTSTSSGNDQKLKQINKELYDFITDKLLQNIHSHFIQPECEEENNLETKTSDQLQNVSNTSFSKKKKKMKKKF